MFDFYLSLLTYDKLMRVISPVDLRSYNLCQYKKKENKLRKEHTGLVMWLSTERYFRISLAT